jgi:hypothetical protein
VKRTLSQICFVVGLLQSLSVCGVDFFYVGAGRAVYRVDADSGNFNLVTSGNLLDDVDGIAVTVDGKLCIANNQGQRLVLVDAATGAQSLIFSKSVGWGWYLAGDSDGTVLVGAGNAVHRVNVSSQTVVTDYTGDQLSDVDGIAIGTDGGIYVANNQGEKIIRIDPVTREQTVVYSVWGWYLATETSGSVLIGGGAAITRYNPQTGLAVAFSAGGLLTDIDGIAVTGKGAVIIADNQGAKFIKIDAANGAQSVLLSGQALGWHLATPIKASAALQRPVFTVPTLLANHEIGIHLSSQSSGTCVIETSSDLLEWQPSVTNVIGAGSLDLRDTPIGGRSRFYRARLSR